MLERFLNFELGFEFACVRASEFKLEFCLADCVGLDLMFGLEFLESVHLDFS